MSEKSQREIKIVIPEDLFSFVFTEEAIEHGLRAKKEMLLALRSLIDARIAYLDKKLIPKPNKKRKVNIS